jgi:hypothetical protein
MPTYARMIAAEVPTAAVPSESSRKSATVEKRQQHAAETPDPRCQKQNGSQQLMFFFEKIRKQLVRTAKNSGKRTIKNVKNFPFCPIDFR